MPEMTFDVRWPDGTVSHCYSPSLVMHEYLSDGGTYSLADFVERTRTALNIASDRVLAKYGRPCSLAAAQLREMYSRAEGFTLRGGDVQVLSMQPDLPDAVGGTP